jgi:hypothetical protein
MQRHANISRFDSCTVEPGTQPDPKLMRHLLVQPPSDHQDTSTAALSARPFGIPDASDRTDTGGLSPGPPPDAGLRSGRLRQEHTGQGGG